VKELIFFGVGVFAIYGVIHDIFGDFVANSLLFLFFAFSYFKFRKFKDLNSKSVVQQQDKNYYQEDKLFQIFPLISQKSELFDEDNEMIHNHLTMSTVTYRVKENDNGSLDIRFNLSPTLESKTIMGAPYAIPFAMEIEMWNKYIYSEDFKKNNYDLSKLPRSEFGSCLIVDIDGNYIELKNSN